MLKVCGERHQMLWYNSEEKEKLDCPLCHCIELLEKAKILPIAFKDIFKPIKRGRPKKK